jgi:centromere protein C
MEEVDGLFSSPEKSPTKLNGFEEDESEDFVGSEMSMDEGMIAYSIRTMPKNR